MLQLSFLLASSLLGAAGDAPCNCAPGGLPQVVSYPLYRPAGRMGMLYRWRTAGAPRTYAPAYQLAQPAVAARAPLGNAVPTATITSVSAYRAAPEPAAPQVAKKYEDKVGHEEDYSWITGHLFYVHSAGGRWVVRYGLPGEVDKFGGSVVLAPGVEMKNYREGDLVCVRGEVLNPERSSPSLGGALYRVNAITIVDRADP